MLVNKVWLAVGNPVHPKGVGRGSSTPNCKNHLFMDLALYMGVLSCWNSKGPSLNCWHNIRNTLLSKILLYTIALRFPFIWTKGSRQNHNSPKPNLDRGVCILLTIQCVLYWLRLSVWGGEEGRSHSYKSLNSLQLSRLVSCKHTHTHNLKHSHTVDAHLITSTAHLHCFKKITHSDACTWITSSPSGREQKQLKKSATCSAAHRDSSLCVVVLIWTVMF